MGFYGDEQVIGNEAAKLFESEQCVPFCIGSFRRNKGLGAFKKKLLWGGG